MNTKTQKYKTVRIPQDSNSLGKKDEVELLMKLADAVPTESYLKSLLTYNLIQWFDWQTINDWHCDIHQEYMAEAQRRNEQTEKTIELRTRVSHLEKMVEKHKDELANAEEEYLNSIRVYDSAAARLRQNANALEDRLQKLADETRKCRDDKARLIQENLELKARLYDTLANTRGGDPE